MILEFKTRAMKIPRAILTNYHGNRDDRSKANGIHEFWIHEEELKVVQANKFVVIGQTCPVGKTIKGSLEHWHIEEKLLVIRGE